MRGSLNAAWLAFALPLVLGACKKSEPLPAALVSSDPSAPITSVEAAAYARELAKRLVSCDPDELAEIWDGGATMRRAKVAAGDEDEGRASRTGSREQMQARKIWKGQCSAMKGGRFEGLGAREVDGAPRALVRMIADPTLNYFEVELARSPDGVVRGIDMTAYTSGEAVSQTIGRMGKNLAATAGLGDKIDVLTALNRVGKLREAGDVAGALALLDELPPAFREDKVVMLTEIGLRPDDDPKFLALAARFERLFPNDPALLMLSIDTHWARAQFDRVLVAIDALDARVRDPYLDALRAAVHIEREDLGAARAAVDRAVTRGPGLEDGWTLRSTLCLALEDFACAVESLRALHERFGHSRPDADAAAELTNGRGLVASEAWRAWSQPTR